MVKRFKYPPPPFFKGQNRPPGGGVFKANSTVYKLVRTNFFWVLDFGQVGGPDVKIQKHPLGGIFKNRTKSRPSNFTKLEKPFYEKFSNFDFVGSIHFQRDFVDKIEMDFFFMSFISKKNFLCFFL